MSVQHLLRRYFHAKDENRPHLLAGVFSADARLEIRNSSAQILFPAVTVGLEAISDVLVRQFNRTYENIYSFYLGKPADGDDAFSCDRLVGMTEKESRCVRTGCGSYDWAFVRTPALRATKLIISIDAMRVMDSGVAEDVMRWLATLEYPWTSVEAVTRAPPNAQLVRLVEYFRH